MHHNSRITIRFTAPELAKIREAAAKQPYYRSKAPSAFIRAVVMQALKDAEKEAGPKLNGLAKH